MNDDTWTHEDDYEPMFGVVAGEDIDAVLNGDNDAGRTWAIGVLNTALERVVTHGNEANELFHLAIEILWQFSEGKAGGSEETTIGRWLDDTHPRGRQWSKFVELVPAFVERMNDMCPPHATKQTPQPISEDDLPF